MNCLKMSAKECEDKVVLHELKEIWPNELSEEDIRFRRFFFSLHSCSLVVTSYSTYESHRFQG